MINEGMEEMLQQMHTENHRLFLEAHFYKGLFWSAVGCVVIAGLALAAYFSA